MKKQSLIHVHGLLATTEAHLEDERGITVEYDAYADVDVSPTSIHRSKGSHKRAVLAYVEDVADAVA